MCCGCKGRELEFCAECLDLQKNKEGICPELKRKLANRKKANQIGFKASTVTVKEKESTEV